VQPEPSYYDVVAFGLLAEHVAEALHKGDRVVVFGRIEEEPWTGRDGVERVTQKLIADGIGPDLRFTGTTSTRPKATMPTKPTPTLDGLLGPEPARSYQDEPF
jgi:single-stranded DNA-binding protein